MSSAENHLPGNPVQWVRDLEAVWQAHDGARAAEGYTEDARLVWGANQSQTGAPLRERPRKWFAYASDLKITKEYVAHTNDCIVTTWDSNYTDPETGKKVHERGIEYFRFRNGKVCDQHAWQHSWQDDEVKAGDFSTD
ncbi:nuclear transport factor 2 family protein [Nitratireductor soli]|uniref:nuclear transport factor 2 family protein n=1 Tax=Nitratireductor soli TaxID=1670619 RepID=UPI00065E73E6|nr:nuclear transport factor 2 family protein [Nitratireductor soli]